MEETRNGSVHRRLPVRRRSNRGGGSRLSRGAMSLSRLPQASWRPLPCFCDLPSRCSDDRGRDARLRGALFLSALRFVGLFTHRRRDRGQPGIARCSGSIAADLRMLDRSSRVLVTAIPMDAAIRARSRRHEPVRGSRGRLTDLPSPAHGMKNTLGRLAGRGAEEDDDASDAGGSPLPRPPRS